MDEINLNDKKRIGTYKPDGSFAAWPELDVFGKPYAHENATIRHIDADHFIVIPPKRDADVSAYLEANKTAKIVPSIAPAAAEK